MSVVRGPDKAGISNLIEIMAAVRGIAPEDVEREFDGSGYGAFKQAVADAVVEYLAPVRERYEQFRGDEAELEAILAHGADKARAIASDTLVDVRRVMGVGPVRLVGVGPGRSLPRRPPAPLTSHRCASSTSSWTSTCSPGRSTCC